MSEILKNLLKITAAHCERNGIPHAHDFTAEDLAPAHEQLDEAERDLYGEREDVPSLQQEREMRDLRLDDNHRAAVPREFKR